jgi:hypothetical protein
MFIRNEVKEFIKVFLHYPCIHVHRMFKSFVVYLGTREIKMCECTYKLTRTVDFC